MSDTGIDYAAKRDYEWRNAIALGHISDPRHFRCDACGQYVAADKVWRCLVTPDSHFTKEEYETLCPECYAKNQ